MKEGEYGNMRFEIFGERTHRSHSFVQQVCMEYLPLSLSWKLDTQ